jgi:signal transduction histidine kinase
MPNSAPVLRESLAPEWLRPGVAAVALGIGVLSIGTGLVEHTVSPMPATHIPLLAVAVALTAGIWGLDLAGVRLPRILFASIVVALEIALTVVGHSGLNTLYLLLLAAWIAYTGSRRESVGTLVLCFATLGIGVVVDAIDRRVAISAWLSWAAGLATIWLMADTLTRQERLVVELRAAQAELAEQTRRAAILEERQRIARELHDTATQSMYSVRMYAEAALRQLARQQTDAAVAHMRDVQELARDALAEMRLLIYELRPPVLEEEGLVSALRARLESVEARAGIAGELIVEPKDAPRLPVAVEQELYGLAHEALNNALKHARPTRIEVRLQRRDEHVALEVVDDGAGFDASEPRKKAGAFGLEGMYERAARLGGELHVSSAPGVGTTVRLEAPL